MTAPEISFGATSSRCPGKGSRFDAPGVRSVVLHRCPGPRGRHRRALKEWLHAVRWCVVPRTGRVVRKLGRASHAGIGTVPDTEAARSDGRAPSRGRTSTPGIAVLN